MTRKQAQSALEQSLSDVSELEVALEYGTWSGSLRADTRTIDKEDCANQALQAGRSNFFLQCGAYLGSLMGMGQEVGVVLDGGQEGQGQCDAVMDEADQLAGGGITQAA